MRYIIISFISLAISITAFAEDQQQNYCHDLQSSKEWEELANKYPDSMDLQLLHAVRIGLCKKVEDGTISFQNASIIFNWLHLQLIEKIKREIETDGKGTGYFRHSF
jgi:hypothetical protein